MEKKKKKIFKQNIIYLGIKIFFIVAVIVCTFILEYGILKCGLVPTKYIVISAIAIIVLDGITALLLLIRSLIGNIIGLLLAIAIGIVSIIGYGYIDKTFNVIKNIVSNDEESITFKVIVGKDSECNELSCLNGENLGILNEYSDKLQEELKNSGTYNCVVYENIEDLVNALKNKEIVAMVITDSMYDVVLEQMKDFEEEVKEAHEVKVRGIIQTLNSDIDANEPFIMYISGLDSRDYSEVAAAGLSDVNILAVVNPKTHKILLINTPRDFYVQLHGTTGLKDKLTHAGLYGIDMSLSTMEDLYSIKINGYVKVNFGAVLKIVDDIDGIDVNSDIGFYSSHIKGWYVNKGMNHMNGAQSLAFARERYAYSSGDRHRGQNQQTVITAIINKISTNKSYLLKYADILNDVSHNLSTNVELEDIQTLVKNQLNTMAGWKVESIQVNGSNSGNVTRSWPKQYTYVMIPDESTIDNARSRIEAVISGG